MEKSVALYPYETNMRNLGIAYSYMGNNKQSIKYLYKALRTKDYEIAYPHKHELDTYLYIAIYNDLYADPYTAKKISQLGINDYPDSFELWILSAVSDYKLNDQKEALKEAITAYKIAPNNQTSYVLESIRNKSEPSLRKIL